MIIMIRNIVKKLKKLDLKQIIDMKNIKRMNTIGIFFQDSRFIMWMSQNLKYIRNQVLNIFKVKNIKSQKI